MRLVAAVLAGGTARRFGADKLRIPLEDLRGDAATPRALGPGDRPPSGGDAAERTALGRVVRACLQAGLETRVAGGAGAAACLATDQVAWVADAPGVAGPLAGLLGVMASAPGAEVLLLAGDLPRLTPRALRRLLAAHQVGVLTGLVAETSEDGREVGPGRADAPEPLATIYPAAMYPALASFAAAGGRSLRRFLADRPGLPLRRVEAGLAPDFLDFDTPEALEALGFRAIREEP